MLIASAEVMNSGGLCATHAYKGQATQSHTTPLGSVAPLLDFSGLMKDSIYIMYQYLWVVCC